MYLKTPNMDSQLASMSPVQLRDLILCAQQQLAHKELLAQERAAIAEAARLDLVWRMKTRTPTMGDLVGPGPAGCADTRHSG